MSPTVFSKKGFRFFFFSREEPRMHIHVAGQGGEAKFWIEPTVELARNHGYSDRQIGLIQGIVEEQLNEIRTAWNEHFRS